MAELPFETYQRVTGKKWTPETRGEAYTRYGVTAPVGSAEANLALQKSLLGGGAETASAGAPTKAPVAPVKEAIRTTPTTEVTRYTEAPAITEASKAFGTGGLFGARTVYSPDEEQNIRDLETQRMQAAIDAITASYVKERTQALTAGEKRLGRVRASSAAIGLIGTPMGETAQTETEQFNAEDLANIEAKKAVAISAIKTQTEDRASSLIEARRLEASGNMEKYLSHLANIKQDATQSLKTIAEKGQISFDDYKQKDPEGLRTLLDQAGLNENTARALYIAKSPAGTYLNKDKPEIIGNKAVFFKQSIDPVTGKMGITQETLDLPGVDKKIKDTMARPDGIYVIYEDGTYSKVGEPTGGVGGKALLSMTEAKSLGVPYGTTRDEAMKLGKVPGMKPGVIQDKQAIQEKIDLVDSLLNSPGLNKAVGPNPLARASLTTWATGKRQAFQGGVKQLISQGTLDALINLKGKGGTLGALSDQEAAMLRSSASKIGAWEIMDDGKPSGFYNVNEGTFREELNRIKKLAQKALENAGETGAMTDEGGEIVSGVKDRADAAGYDYQSMLDQGYTDADITAALAAQGL